MENYVGFVLVSAAPKKERTIYKGLAKVPSIKEVHSLFGEYDMLAKVVASDPETLGSIVVNNIRTIDGIVDTKTLAGTSISRKLGLEKSLKK